MREEGGSLHTGAIKADLAISIPSILCNTKSDDDMLSSCVKSLYIDSFARCNRRNTTATRKKEGSCISCVCTYRELISIYAVHTYRTLLRYPYFLYFYVINLNQL